MTIRLTFLTTMCLAQLTISIEAYAQPTQPYNEPVELVLPRWTTSDRQESQHRLITYQAPTGTCRVELDRWIGMPPNAGGIMQVSSRRAVQFGGRPAEVLTTSVFMSTEMVVNVLFHHAHNSLVRIIFRSCGNHEIDQVLSTARVHTP